jgi:hypothetical protein
VNGAFAASLMSGKPYAGFGYTLIMQIEIEVLQVILSDWEVYERNISENTDLYTRYFIEI